MFIILVNIFAITYPIFNQYRQNAWRTALYVSSYILITVPPEYIQECVNNIKPQRGNLLRHI